MEEVKQQPLQGMESRERDGYKSLFLKKRTVCTRQSVYVSGEIHGRIARMVGVIAGKRVSIGNFIDNVLEHHLNSYKEVISSLYGKKPTKVSSTRQKEIRHESSGCRRTDLSTGVQAFLHLCQSGEKYLYGKFPKIGRMAFQP